MKKKLLFMVINMNLGGTEKALLNMIAEIPRGKFEITILMLEKYGELLQSIPCDVNVKYIKDYHKIKDLINTPLHLLSLQYLKDGKYFNSLIITVVYAWTRVRKNKGLLYKYVLKNFPMLNEEYDIAIAYAGPMDFISYFVIKKIKAKKRIQWIHFDINKINFNKTFATKFYNKFDQIFVVSKEGKDKLVNVIPKLRRKIDCFLNILSQDLVRDLSNKDEGFNDAFQGVRILTVGRLSKEKGQDLIVPVLSRLKANGANVRWYCVGEGKEKKKYEKLAHEFKVEHDFILLGSKLNPYPFMKECNIYVQPSRHEGYCITLAEARCFNKPIITTNFTGASEQIKYKETGLIVEFDEMQMFHAIKSIIDNTELADVISSNLKKETINTKKELNKLYSIANKI
ncbi:glycosyltransferase [Rossellomorea aquimaris]|uniref:Glycosyltransferase involved in cell wall biosynthesis n=1 Tax=Rossellomorea aquimaris TaxID=189382 RepID=A0A366ENV6_9BACI|nr:glycosyltransferase [Rossellomorea aquimaris]RBP03155.1 glycosyltransferase involved in cell wall biosynthesis [Rossellomorea aquimaris]